MRTTLTITIAILAGLIAPVGAIAEPAPPSEPCTISGTKLDDVLVGTAGRDVICGFGGNDSINGNGGPDLLIGGGGNDEIEGGEGDDQIFGGSGNDTMRPGQGSNTMAGGSGDSDTLDYSTFVDPQAAGDATIRGYVHLGVEGASSDTTLRAGVGIGSQPADRLYQQTTENVIGSRYDDRIFGSKKPNVLTGGAGDDHVEAGRGDDTIVPTAYDGDDEYLGQGGTDSISYAGLPGPIAQDWGTFLDGGEPSNSAGLDPRVFRHEQFSVARLRAPRSTPVRDGGGVIENPDAPPIGPIGSTPTDEDALSTIERLTGTSSDDRLAGVAGTQVEGGPGSDLLFGTARLLGGPGDDDLHGINSFGQTLDCGEGADTVTADSILDGSPGCEAAGTRAWHVIPVLDHRGINEPRNSVGLWTYSAGPDSAPPGATVHVEEYDDTAGNGQFWSTEPMIPRWLWRNNSPEPSCTAPSSSAGATCVYPKAIHVGAMSAVYLTYVRTPPDQAAAPLNLRARSGSDTSHEAVSVEPPDFLVDLAAELLSAPYYVVGDNPRDFKTAITTTPISGLERYMRLTIPDGVVLSKNPNAFNSCDIGEGDEVHGPATLVCSDSETLAMHVKRQGEFPVTVEGVLRAGLEFGPNIWDPDLSNNTQTFLISGRNLANLATTMTNQAVEPGGGSFKLRLSNSGPFTAVAVNETITMPAAMSAAVTSVTSPGGNCGLNRGRSWSCSYPKLASGAGRTITVNLGPVPEGTYTVTGTARHDGDDPNPDNDTAVANVVSVAPPR